MDIKFRGKQDGNSLPEDDSLDDTQEQPSNDGQWVYGSLLVDKEHMHIVEEPVCGFAMCYDESLGYMAIGVRKETVGQYINHKDVNDTEIYTGDIVDTGPEPWEGKYEIVWDDKELKFGMLAQNGSISSLSYWINNPYKQLKVVGNKFDNPEMQTKSNQ